MGKNPVFMHFFALATHLFWDECPTALAGKDKEHKSH
jgi:hypothetical protein